MLEKILMFFGTRPEAIKMALLVHAFAPDDVPVPGDPYGLSKYEAEQGLLALAQETGITATFVR
jgi:nucleoside-diphosphate-sugar epimerase